MVEGGRVSDLQQRINEWQNKTFPDGSAFTIYEHLRDEIIELGDSRGDPEEAADCVILLFGIAGKLGFDLMQEVERKFKINKARKWGKADSRGVVNHVEVEG